MYQYLYVGKNFWGIYENYINTLKTLFFTFICFRVNSRYLWILPLMCNSVYWWYAYVDKMFIIVKLRSCTPACMQLVSKLILFGSLVYVYVCVCTCACVRVCSPPRLSITGDVFWCDMDPTWLVSCFMVTVTIIVNGCGLVIDMHYGNLPNRS